MLLRHLSHQQYTLAAINDVIERGRLPDGIEPRNAARRQPELLDKIKRVCAARISDPDTQRYHFWNNDARARPRRCACAPAPSAPIPLAPHPLPAFATWQGFR